MAYENIKADRDGAALVITIHRPDKRNALSLRSIDEIAAAAREADADAGLRGII